MKEDLTIPRKDSIVFSTQVISTATELVSNQEEIETFLLNCSDNHSFFQTPHFILAELKRKNSGDPFLIISRTQERISSIAFGNISSKRFSLSLSIIPLPAPKSQTLTFPGNGVVYDKNCDKNTALNNIFSILKQYSNKFELIALNEIEHDSHLWQYITQNFTTSNSFFRLSMSLAKQEINSSHILEKSYDHWHKSLRAKTRRRMSWSRNRFKKRAPQPIQISRITDTENVAEFIQKVHKIRQNSWQGKTISSNRKDIESEVEFLKEIATLGWLRSYLLECGDLPAAYEISVQYNDECTFLERGYDQKFQQLAPGSYLTDFILQDCYSVEQPAVINFGFGENEFKQRLRNQTTYASYANLTMRNRWRLYVTLQNVLNNLENKIRYILKKTNLEHRVRKVIKRKKS